MRVFSRMEQQARDLLLSEPGRPWTLDEVWSGIGMEQRAHWRVRAADLMRRVALKSLKEGPQIEKVSGSGPGAVAKYRVVERER